MKTIVIRMTRKLETTAQRLISEILASNPVWTGDFATVLRASPSLSNGEDDFGLALFSKGITPGLDGPEGRKPIKRAELKDIDAGDKTIAKTGALHRTPDKLTEIRSDAIDGGAFDLAAAIKAKVFDVRAQKVIGTKHGDLLEGGRKSDVIVARGGDDTVIATLGDDLINLGGGRKDTVLFEDLGARSGGLALKAAGKAFKAKIDGDAQTVKGAEVFAGTPFDDRFVGGSGPDVFFGLAGADAIVGKGGPDRLFGEDGDDVIRGGEGGDRIGGGADEDSLFGGDGPDVIRGGPGNDRIWGGHGDDILWGGPDEDNFVYDDVPAGHDTVADFAPGDALVFQGPDFTRTPVSYGDETDGVLAAWGGVLSVFLPGVSADALSGRLAADGFVYVIEFA